MSKSKQPEFMVGELYFQNDEAGNRIVYVCQGYEASPQVIMQEYGKEDGIQKGPVSMFLNFRHLTADPRPAHRPKGSGKKTVKIETAPPDPANKPPPRPFVGGIPQGMGNPDKQASTPEVVSPTPAHTDEAPKNEPVPFDPATFTMKVGPPCVMSVSGKTWTGGRLRETLTNLLAFYGITGSPAELKAKLVLNYPDSQGLREMLSILKGGTK